MVKDNDGLYGLYGSCPVVYPLGRGNRTIRKIRR